MNFVKKNNQVKTGMLLNWKKMLGQKNFRIEFIISLVLLSSILFSFTHFLDFVENRHGIVLNDPVLSLFSPVDLNWLIFFLIYLSLVLSFINLAREPEGLMLAIQSYTLMIAFRIAAMYLIPLDPPQKMIPLNDPFVQFFGTGKLLLKDLFFSGHTATIFLLYLVNNHRQLRSLLLIFTIAAGISLLLQHVHYSIDVLAAPFFAYGSFRITYLLRKNFAFQIESYPTNNYVQQVRKFNFPKKISNS